MKSSRKQKRRMSAENIARLADKGKDVSRLFTNARQMMGPMAQSSGECRFRVANAGRIG